MIYVVYGILYLGSFFAMEVVAWASHKYVMHGFLWRWHKPHHRLRKTRLDTNDLFGLIFAIPSIACLLIGYLYSTYQWLSPIGWGIMTYGLFYVLFHDMIVHQRIRVPIPKKSAYLQRMIDAHHYHHAHHTKTGCASFGFLFASQRHAAAYKQGQQRKQKHQALKR